MSRPQPPGGRSYQAIKRLIDFVLSAIALVLLSPVICVLALLIFLVIGRPVMFRQTRPGSHGRVFELVKFRTMKDARDHQGALLPDEQRMTAFGSWLRRTSLDELPGLINVLRGEMSLVGPRPLLVDYLPLYTAQQARRHDVRPGITGWAQVNGRNAIDWDDKLAMDVWYVDNCSFGLDLKIIWRTMSKVIRADDITRAGHVTTPRFTGSRQ